jgi:hypothetical protein
MCFNNVCIPATHFDIPLPSGYPSPNDTCIAGDDDAANGEDACIDNPGFCNGGPNDGQPCSTGLDCAGSGCLPVNSPRCVTTEPQANCE